MLNNNLWGISLDAPIPTMIPKAHGVLWIPKSAGIDQNAHLKAVVIPIM